MKQKSLICQPIAFYPEAVDVQITKDQILRMDIMLKEQFVHTIKLPVSKGQTLNLSTIYALMEEKLPTLKGKPYRVFFGDRSFSSSQANHRRRKSLSLRRN